MPRGRVPEREVTCRACGEPFRTTKVGKAAQLCHRPECDAARGVETPEQRAERAAKREREQREREDARKRARAEVLAARIAENEAALRDLGYTLREPTPPPPPAELVGSGPVADALRGLPRAVIARHVSEDVGKGSLRRAIAVVAHATGAHATADACRRLAVEALAWEFRLRLSAREVGEGAGPSDPGSLSRLARKRQERADSERAELEAARERNGRPGDPRPEVVV